MKWIKVAPIVVAVVAAATPLGRARAISVSPIQHVVIVYQENHSFDNVLGLMCVQTQRCDGSTVATLHDGSTRALTATPDIVPAVNHATGAQLRAIDGGKMDGFDRLKGCTVNRRYACLSQYPQGNVANLWELASAFAVSDRTFSTNAIPSFGAHLDLAAQTRDGFTGDNPFKNSPHRSGWGCDSLKDANWQDPQGVVSRQPACVPNASGVGPYRTSPVQYVPTIMDRLDSAARSWRLYTVPAADHSGNYGGYVWNLCTYFYECASTQTANVTSTDQVITDATNGTLPDFSMVLPADGPTGSTSQHNNQSMIVGDDFIGQVVSAIENGPDWSSTAIFITYDDCGCFYDHVPPPVGLGIRVPMVIVSPYARPGFTDSTPATFSSMIAFAEHVLGLTPLTAEDTGAYDFSAAFDYSQAPLPAVQMIRERVSKAEARYLAANPPGDDGT
jgi:phospholipase C